MPKMMAACGVLCSDCPAFHGAEKGAQHQQKTAAAWHRIYGLNEPPGNISCGGCLGPDAELFHTSRSCEARRCCLRKGLDSCGQCPEIGCALLEKAQAQWDGVPAIGKKLSRGDFACYAKPYCNHRRRLAQVRRAFPSNSR